MIITLKGEVVEEMFKCKMCVLDFIEKNVVEGTKDYFKLFGKSRDWCIGSWLEKVALLGGTDLRTISTPKKLIIHIFSV